MARLCSRILILLALVATPLVAAAEGEAPAFPPPIPVDPDAITFDLKFPADQGGGSASGSALDLPLRFHEQTPLHRNEASGVLSGLTRVR